MDTAVQILLGAMILVLLVWACLQRCALGARRRSISGTSGMTARRKKPIFRTELSGLQQHPIARQYLHNILKQDGDIQYKVTVRIR